MTSARRGGGGCGLGSEVREALLTGVGVSSMLSPCGGSGFVADAHAVWAAGDEVPEPRDTGAPPLRQAQPPALLRGRPALLGLGIRARG